MKPRIVTLIICLIAGWSSSAQYQKLSIQEIRQVLKQAIDLPELQQYFHYRENDNERNQLVIKEFGLVNAENMVGILKFGRELIVLSESQIEKRKIKRYLNIGDWTPVNDKLRLQLNYDVEGITVNYVFEKRNDDWFISKSEIREE